MYKFIWTHCTHMHINISTCINNIHPHIHTQTLTYIGTYTHTHLDIHMHTHTCTHKLTHKFQVIPLEIAVLKTIKNQPLI